MVYAPLLSRVGVTTPMLRGETPEYLPPAWKYLFFASSVTSGLVNKKITTKSTKVVNPRVNAKPRTLPTETI
jgi:hypothetical protein